MKLFKILKDGGPESKVTGYFLIEWKKLFSIVLLRFDEGSREAYHTHAFNSINWVLKGWLMEFIHNSTSHPTLYGRSFKPVITRRDTYHQVLGIAKHTWVLSFRGQWSKTWEEYLPKEGRSITLTHGRKEVLSETRR